MLIKFQQIEVPTPEIAPGPLQIKKKLKIRDECNIKLWQLQQIPFKPIPHH